MSTIERNHTVFEANSNFEKEIKKLGLASAVTCLRDSNLVSTYHCVLTTESQASFFGFGKGFGQQSKLSAQFEALEDFTSIQAPSTLALDFFSPCEIQEKRIPIFTQKLPRNFFEKNSNYETKLPCIPIHQITAPEKFNYLPFVCVTPTYLDFIHPHDKFSYDLLYLHQTANGVAIGNDLTEALIHAISESVERDAYSLLIRKLFLEDTPIHLVDISSLPKNISNVIALIQKESGYECLILKAPCPVNVSVFVTFLVSPTLKTPIKGLGCSLDENYALERSVLEMVEQYDAYELGVKEEDENALNDLKIYPKLYQWAQFNFVDILKNRKITTLKFNPQHSRHSNLESYLQDLINRVTCHYDIFTSTLYASEHVTTVKVILPQASDLYIFTKGILSPEAIELELK